MMSYLGRKQETVTGEQTMLPSLPQIRSPLSPALLVWGIAGLAGAAGLLFGLVSVSPRTDAELVPLLRFMAVLKAGMAIGATALVHWRLRGEPAPALKAALLASAALMMSAPGLIWNLNHIVLGAVLFHAGLIVFLVAAARDGLGFRLKKPATH